MLRFITFRVITVFTICLFLTGFTYLMLWLRPKFGRNFKSIYFSYPILQTKAYNLDHFNIKFLDRALPNQYQAPEELLNPTVTNTNMDENRIELRVVESENPEYHIIRRETNETILKIRDLSISSYYQKFTAETPTNEIYGLGERIKGLQFKPGKYEIFIVDRIGIIDDGSGALNAQGHQPAYLMKEKSKKYHMVLLNNINFQEINIHSDNSYTWNLVGGIIDLHIILGDENPETCITMYHRLIGGWAIPPFWALGYHHNKWFGYKGSLALIQVIEQFAEHNIPMDALWSDIEYMEDYLNFSIDKNAYWENMAEIYKRFKKKWLPVFDTIIPLKGRSPGKCYPDYEDLILKCPRLDGNGLEYLQINGWGDLPSHVIDFMHPKAEAYWKTMIKNVDDYWRFDGFWNDENEITRLCYESGEIACHNKKDIYRKYYKTPFFTADGCYCDPDTDECIGESCWYDMRIIGPDCVHHDGSEEFNVRTLTNFYQSKYSYNYLIERDPLKLPFLMTRANVYGVGRYAFHWIPDMVSDWPALRTIIGGMITYGMFGIPFVGGDMCGFIGLRPGHLEERTGAELCTRWHQAATFQPFLRNSHILALFGVDNTQEPFRYPEPYLSSMRGSLKLRYSFLKYYYALYLKKESIPPPAGNYSYTPHNRKIGTIVQALSLFFKDIPFEYGNLIYEEEFLIGDAILVSPALYKEISYVNTYFPAGYEWFDLRNFNHYSGGESYNISANLEELVPHFLKSRSIVFIQDVNRVLSTSDLNLEFTAVIALDKGCEASGSLLAVDNYDDENFIANCVNKNCIANFLGRLDIQKKEFKLSVDYPINIDENEGIQIKKVVILTKDKIYIKDFEDPLVVTKDFSLKFALGE